MPECPHDGEKAGRDEFSAWWFQSYTISIPVDGIETSRMLQEHSGYLSWISNPAEINDTIRPFVLSIE
jgi:hypothetical protein